VIIVQWTKDCVLSTIYKWH